MTPSATKARIWGQNPQSPFVLAKEQGEGFLRHFGFRESPFGVTPNPEFLFWSRMHDAALQALIASIESNLGFSVLVGRPGTGKTTLLFHLLAQYADSARTAFVFQTQCRAHDLIRHIASELELAVDGRNEVSLHQKLNEMLLNEARAGRKVVIVIDEAQNLHPSSLEALRLLSDFETSHSKLLHVILSGSTRLGETLLTPELSQFAQRISSISRLEALAEDEVAEYVRFRLAVVASRGAEGVFSSEALAEIASRSEGVPRVINSLCYRALILAYTCGQSCVSRELVRQAARDLDFSDSRVSTEVIQLTNVREERLTAASPELSAISGEPLRNPMTPAVDRPRVPDIERDIPTQKKPAIPDLGRHNIRSSNEPRGVDEGPRSSVGIATWSESSQYRFIGLIAAIIFLACGALVWNEFGSRHSTSAAAGREAQPTIREAQDEIPLNRQLDAPTTAAAPKVSSRQPPVSLATEGRTNLVPRSDIQSQSSIPEERMAPPNLQSNVNDPKHLAPLVSGVPSEVPRLETPEPPGPLEPRETSPRQPVKRVRPEYPKKAVLSHIEGDVQVELTIDQDGKVEKVRGLSGNSILLQAAKEAAWQWQYSPATGDETADLETIRVQFTFRLNPEDR